VENPKKLKFVSPQVWSPFLPMSLYGPFPGLDWYDDFHHGKFAFDDASPLSVELQATP
jgi:hypothetical protein